LFKIVDLYETTRSCEGDISDAQLSKFSPTLESYQAGQDIPICGKCFWCQERAWAETTIPDMVARITK
jgi:7-cyano-7-deazaguanine synthase in queuosine biosynthesis